jgi:hypothetical protein
MGSLGFVAGILAALGIAQVFLLGGDEAASLTMILAIVG